MSEGQGDPEGLLNIATQMSSMQKLIEMQTQLMQLQVQQHTNSTLAMSTIKQVKIPEGRYNMNANEFKSFRKDCTDYKKLTNYSDLQVVLQIRMNMDDDLKRAIDTNFNNIWDNFTVGEALDAIQTIVKHASNPVVHRKDFDDTCQREVESFKEFLTRLKACAADCSFICRFDDSHELTEYHMVNRMRSGVLDKNLQQDLLQKADILNNLTDITQFSENFETARDDREKLSNASATLSTVVCNMTGDDIIAAISSYKKSKGNTTTDQKKVFDQRNSFQGKKCHICGYDWPHPQGQDASPEKNKIRNSCKKVGHFERVCRKSSKSISTFIISTLQKIKDSQSKLSNLSKLNVFIGKDDNQPPEELIADTGAQATVGGPHYMKLLNVHPDKLNTPPRELKDAGGKRMTLLGSYPVFIYHNNQLLETDIYFVKGVNNIYICHSIPAKDYTLSIMTFLMSTLQLVC